MKTESETHQSPQPPTSLPLHQCPWRPPVLHACSWNLSCGHLPFLLQPVLRWTWRVLWNGKLSATRVARETRARVRAQSSLCRRRAPEGVSGSAQPRKMVRAEAVRTLNSGFVKRLMRALPMHVGPTFSGGINLSTSPTTYTDPKRGKWAPTLNQKCRKHLLNNLKALSHWQFFVLHDRATRVEQYFFYWASNIARYCNKYCITVQ